MERSLGTRVLVGVLCVLMMFEWPVLAEGLGGSNWANHRPPVTPF